MSRAYTQGMSNKDCGKTRKNRFGGNGNTHEGEIEFDTVGMVSSQNDLQGRNVLGVFVCLLFGCLVGLLLLGGIYFRNCLYRQGKTRMTDMVTRRIFPRRSYCLHKVGSMEIWGFMTSRNKIGK